MEPWHLWRKVSGQTLWDLLASGVTSPMALYAYSIPVLSPSLLCFPLQDSRADPGRNVQRGASRRSLVHGRLGEPKRKDTSPQLREVYAQGLLHEPRKGWENLLQALQFPFSCMLGNPGFQGVDEDRTARTVIRSILEKARISMTN